MGTAAPRSTARHGAVRQAAMQRGVAGRGGESVWLRLCRRDAAEGRGGAGRVDRRRAPRN